MTQCNTTNAMLHYSVINIPVIYIFMEPDSQSDHADTMSSPICHQSIVRATARAWGCVLRRS